MNEILHVFQTGWYCCAHTCCPSRELDLLVTANTVARKRLDSVIAQDLQELVLKTWKWQSFLVASCSLFKYQQNESVAWTLVLRVAISRLQVAQSCFDYCGESGTDDIDKDADLILPQ
eukprot:3933785-Amphidinium_carterae.1